MKVIVLGSGVIGLTSAWYLSQQGHQVTVVDRQSYAANETSFANAGQISYGYSSPWAAPGIPLKAIKWLTQQHAPLKIKPQLSLDTLIWASKMIRNCTAQRYDQNKSRMLRIADYSRQCLNDLNENTNIEYQGRQLGTLQVFRTAKQLHAVQKDIKLLKEANIKFELLDQAGCVEKEPGLREVRSKILGGLHLSDDETGDCFLFCQELKKIAASNGVEFIFDTQIKKLNASANRVLSVSTDKGELTADSYVLACGSYSAQLLSPLNIHLPTYPVKGYSLTLPIHNSDQAPQSTVMDETYKVALTRFKNRLRVAGTAELNGFNLDLPEKRRKTIELVIQDLFPNAGDLQQAEFWTGLRPMTPDGTPIIGATPIDNLFTNTGHGTLGWTMACGSGKLLADIVSQRKPEIEYSDLSVSRYQK